MIVDASLAPFDGGHFDTNVYTFDAYSFTISLPV